MEAEKYLEIYHAKMRDAKTFSEIRAVADEAVAEINKDDDDYSSDQLSLMLNLFKNHPSNPNKFQHKDLFELWKIQSKGEGGFVVESLKKHARIIAREKELKRSKKIVKIIW